MIQTNQAVMSRGNEIIVNSVGEASPFTGTTNTAIVQMNVAANQFVGGNSFEETRSATLGTSVAISSTGIYEVNYDYAFTGAFRNSTGISVGATGTITADPIVGTNGVIKAADMDSNASMTLQSSLCTVFSVSSAQIAAGTAVVRFHATDSGAGAPLGTVVASVAYRITKIFNTPF